MSTINWLPNASAAFLQWSASVYRKLFEITPWRTCGVVVSEITNQISLLLAFFLPLKVIILLGSSGTPRYFPDFLLAYGREELAIGLSIVAVAGYCLHLICKKLSASLSNGAEKAIAGHTEKMTVFVGQADLTRAVYHQFSSVLASSIFFVSALSLMGYLYPTLAGFVLACVLMCYLETAITARRSPTARDWLANHSRTLVTIYSSVMFLLVFAFIVVDYVWFVKPNILTAIICIILFRQLSTRLSISVVDAVGLYSRRAQIDMLLFPGKSFHVNRQEKSQGYWSLLKRDRRSDWLQSMLSQLHELPIEIDKAEWVETGPAGLAAFDVEVESDNGAVEVFRKALQSGAR